MLKEVVVLSSVATPQVLEALSVDCSRLREAISRTKEMIHLKREERDKGLLTVVKGLCCVCSFSCSKLYNIRETRVTIERGVDMQHSCESTYRFTCLIFYTCCLLYNHTLW